MALPPEMVDEILDNLQDEKRALCNCSLVAKSWTYPSQKRLFTSVDLTLEIYQTWRENVSPTKAELLEHVRILSCRRFYFLGPALCGDYFGSLRHLQRLVLYQTGNIEPNITASFPVFQNTLSSLSLSFVFLAWSTFIELVDYFPNLKELRFNESSFHLGGDPLVSPPLSRPARGKLYLSSLTWGSMGALSRGLPAQDLAYSELEIISIFDRHPSRIQPVISACEKTLTHLKLDPYDCEP